MIQLEKVIYTAKTHTTGGRDGTSRTSDGRLDVKLSPPGGPGSGTNPEQLFAACLSACFLSAIKHAAARAKIALPNDVSIDAEIDLGPAGEGYAIAARLDVSLPGVAHDVGQRLIDTAERVCTYARATRGNISVLISLV